MRRLMTIFLLCFSGCVTHNYDNAKMLMERNDFPAAVEAALLFVEKCLKIINALEQELRKNRLSIICWGDKLPPMLDIIQQYVNFHAALTKEKQEVEQRLTTRIEGVGVPASLQVCRQKCRVVAVNCLEHIGRTL